MDERQRHAWRALGLGPAWRLRRAAAGPAAAPVVADLPPVAPSAGRGDRPARAGSVPASSLQVSPGEGSSPEGSSFELASLEVTSPELSAPELSAPELSAPELSAPELSAPELPSSVLSSPGASPPEVSADEASGRAASPNRPAAPAVASLEAPIVASPSGAPPSDLGRHETDATRREAAIARLDWEALGAAVAGCTACGLCAGRRNTVFGVGPRPADWLLVGEAPGEQEDLRGEPFVGPAGRLLDQMLLAVGVDRPRDAFIANVLKCRPPGNRNPQPDEVARCEPFLLRQVELLRPRLIVVLGRFAAQSLLGTDASIASLRGRVHRYDARGRAVPLVVTYHPAYLLRNLPDKARAWADLRLARRTFDAAPTAED